MGGLILAAQSPGSDDDFLIANCLAALKQLKTIYWSAPGGASRGNINAARNKDEQQMFSRSDQFLAAYFLTHQRFFQLSGFNQKAVE